MADMTLTVPLGASVDASNLVSIAATGTATAGTLKVLVPSGTTNADIVRAVDLLQAALRRDQNVFKA